MAELLQDYFNRMTALNRQRGMTGNMQYGRALDSSIAEGYFDSAQKNKAQSQSLANQKRALDMQQQNQDMTNKALNHNMLMGWANLGAQAVGAGTKLYLGRNPKDKRTTGMTQPQALSADYSQSDFTEAMGGPEGGTMIDYMDYNDVMPTTDFQIDNNILDWNWDASTLA